MAQRQRSSVRFWDAATDASSFARGRPPPMLRGSRAATAGHLRALTIDCSGVARILVFMAINLHPLSEERFLGTFSPPMHDVTKSAEEIMDIWEYAEAVFASDFAEQETGAWDVAYVYQDGSNAWQHVLVNTDVPDAYVVFVISIAKRELLGHRFLNLRQMYGLTQ